MEFPSSLKSVQLERVRVRIVLGFLNIAGVELKEKQQRVFREFLKLQEKQTVWHADIIRFRENRVKFH